MGVVRMPPIDFSSSSANAIMADWPCRDFDFVSTMNMASAYRSKAHHRYHMVVWFEGDAFISVTSKQIQVRRGVVDALWASCL
jgi:hypothetical protein